MLRAPWLSMAATGDLDDFHHGVPVPFHARYQAQLRAGAVQIVSLAVDMEIAVPAKMVGQKAHAAFKRHQLRSQGQQVQLTPGQLSAQAAQVAAHIGLEQRQRKRHPAQVALILGGRICAGAHRIAEIPGAQARHHRIQVDHAYAAARLFIQKHVVHLGVVMRHAQRHAARFQLAHQRIRLRGSLHAKGDFLAHLGPPAHRIGADGVGQLLQTRRRVVEIGQGGMQRRRVKPAQLALKAPERLACRGEPLRGVRHVDRNRSLDEQIDPPQVAGRIRQPGPAFHGAHQRERLARGITSLAGNHAAQVVGDALDVAHHEFGVGKHIAIDPLQDIPPFRPRPWAHRQAERVIDVARAIGFAGHFPAWDVKEMRDVKGAFRQHFHGPFPLFSVPCRTAAQRPTAGPSRSGTENMDGLLAD